MASPVVSVRPDMSTKEAAALLTTHGYPLLPVVDAYDNLVGVVSEADLSPPAAPNKAAAVTAQAGSILQAIGGTARQPVRPRRAAVPATAASLSPPLRRDAAISA